MSLSIGRSRLVNSFVLFVDAIAAKWKEEGQRVSAFYIIPKTCYTIRIDFVRAHNRCRQPLVCSCSCSLFAVDLIGSKCDATVSTVHSSVVKQLVDREYGIITVISFRFRPAITN